MSHRASNSHPLSKFPSPSFLVGLAIGFGFSVIFANIRYRTPYETNLHSQHTDAKSLQKKQMSHNANKSRPTIICIGDSLTESGSWPHGK